MSASTFHVAAAVLTLGLQASAFVDARWHIHYGFLADDFFTPTHYGLHGTWLALCALVIFAAVTGARAGIPLRASLPPGYGWLALGAALWGVAGLGDLAWHTAFGLEANVDAVYTPSHLGLNVAAALMYLGVLRHSLNRRATSGRSLASEIPLVTSLAAIYAGVMWLMWYSDPLSDDFAAAGAAVKGLPAMSGVQHAGPTAEIAGLSGVILTALVLMLFLLFALRHLELPVGGITVIVAWHALFKGWSMDTLVYAPAFIAAAIVGDAFWAWMRAQAAGVRPWSYRAIGALVPAVGISLYLVTVTVAFGGVVWPVHLWVGAIALSALAGIAASWAIVSPRLSPEIAG